MFDKFAVERMNAVPSNKVPVFIVQGPERERLGMFCHLLRQRLRSMTDKPVVVLRVPHIQYWAAEDDNLVKCALLDVRLNREAEVWNVKVHVPVGERFKPEMLLTVPIARQSKPQGSSDPTNQNHNNPGDPCDSCRRPLTGGGGIGPTSCRHEDCDLYDDCGGW